MSENLKKLTGKFGYEPVAKHLINDCDTKLFQELIENDSFLFDFVKQNVASRLEKVCNAKNYLNLLNFLKFYSPSYEEFIVSTLAKYANEDLTDKMLELFENGTEDEKTYCAKFFSYIQDPLAIDLLKLNAYSENSSLSSNCASTLAILGDTESYNEALNKLNSNDDFEKLDAVKFLVSYGDKKTVTNIIDTIKSSNLSENIAGELLYLVDLFELLNTNKTDGLFVLNNIINGLGEILGVSQTLDFQLYDVFDYLLNNTLTPETAVVLINAKDKFETLTENDEYLFDETKDVKQEIYDIKNLLNSAKLQNIDNSINEQLTENSLFVFTAIELSSNIEKIKQLLNSKNQTLVLKALEKLKELNSLTTENKETALSHISDENIKNIIQAI